MIVRAPATSANLGPGFDCVGVALDLWNELEVTDGDGVEVEGCGAGELALDESNLGVRAYARLADPAGKRFRFVNRIPLERGLGSSAAAIALGLVAAAPTAEPDELLATALELEPHADNLAAALVGGVTLVCDGRIARVASSLPLTPVAVVPEGRTSAPSSPATACRRPCHTPMPPSPPVTRRCSARPWRAATPISSPARSSTGCTSPTGRRPCSTPSARTCPRARAAPPCPGRGRP